MQDQLAGILSREHGRQQQRCVLEALVPVLDGAKLAFHHPLADLSGGGGGHTLAISSSTNNSSTALHSPTNSFVNINSLQFTSPSPTISLCVN